MKTDTDTASFLPLLDQVARAYLEFAALFAVEQPRGTPRQRLYDSARVAWRGFDEARARLTAVVSSDGGSVAARLGELARAEGERFEACLRAASAGPPLFDAAVRSRLASDLLALALGEPATGLNGMTSVELLRTLPRRPSGILAGIALARGELAVALEYVSRTSLDEPEDLVVRCEVLLATGRVEEAASVLARLRDRAAMNLHNRPLAARVALESARQLRRQGDLGSAVAVLGDELERQPEDTSLSLALGVALRDAGCPLAALPYLAAAASSAPAVLVELGTTRLHMLDLEAARAFFAAAQEDPRTVEAARLGMARADLLEGSAGRALSLIEALPDAGDGTLTPLIEHATALLDLGEIQAASKLLSRGIDLGVERGRVLVLIARAARLKGALDEARDAVELALQEPDSPFPALVELGLLEVALGNPPDPAGFVRRHAAALKQPQEFLHVTGFRPEEAAASRRFLLGLIDDLNRSRIPIAAAGDGELDRMLLHLQHDLPGVVAPAARVGSEPEVFEDEPLLVS